MFGASDSYLPAQVETMVFLLAVLIGVIVWGFFQRNPSE
jgi:hypothetical protein